MHQGVEANRNRPDFNGSEEGNGKYFCIQQQKGNPVFHFDVQALESIAYFICSLLNLGIGEGIIPAENRCLLTSTLSDISIDKEVSCVEFFWEIQVNIHFVPPCASLLENDLMGNH